MKRYLKMTNIDYQAITTKPNICFVQTLTNGNLSVTVYDGISSAPIESYEILPDNTKKEIIKKRKVYW